MTDIEKFLEFLDNLNNMIDISLKSSLENNSENLEINIVIANGNIVVENGKAIIESIFV